METVIHNQIETRQNNLLVIKGTLAVLWGVFALFAGVMSDPLILVYTFGVLNILAGILTLLFSLKNAHLSISKQWLLLESLVELAAGITFTFFVHDLQRFLLFMSYGILFIVIVQFIYGFTLLLADIFHAKNLIARFISLIVGCIIAVGLISGKFSSTASFVIIGGFSILYGILNAQFAYKLQNIIMGEAS